jgi:hypothetical protein
MAISNTFIDGVTALSGLPFTSNYTKSSRADNMFTFAELIQDPWWNAANTKEDMSHPSMTGWSAADKGKSIDAVGGMGENQHTINELLRDAIANLQSKSSSIDVIKYGGSKTFAQIPANADNGSLFILTDSGTIPANKSTSNKDETYGPGDAAIVYKSGSTVKYSILQVNIDESSMVSYLWVTGGGNKKTVFEWILGKNTHTASFVPSTDDIIYTTTSSSTVSGAENTDIKFVFDDAKATKKMVNNILGAYNATSPSADQSAIKTAFNGIMGSAGVSEISTDLLDGYSVYLGVPTTVSKADTGIRTWTYNVTTTKKTYTEATAGVGLPEDDFPNGLS